jgi:hypothetical protein
VFEDYSENYN